MSDPAKEPNPPKKPEPRTAGAPTTQEDVFSSSLPDFAEEEASASTDVPGEEKFTFKEMMRDKMEKGKDWAKTTRRKSGDILTGFGNKKKDEDMKEKPKDGDTDTKSP